MYSSTFEQMSIGQILGRTFKVYKSNFVRFVAIVAIIQIPIALISFLSYSTLQSRMKHELDAESFAAFKQDHTPVVSEDGKTVYLKKTADYEGTDGYSKSDLIRMVFGGTNMFIVGILSLIGYMLCQAALTKSISEYYLDSQISVCKANRLALPKLLTLIGAGLMVGLIVWAGFLLLIVPGVIFSLWYSLTIPAIMTENLKAMEGMRRSKVLASGNLGKIFLIGFITIVIMYVINIPFFWGSVFLSSRLASDSIIMQTIIRLFAQLAARVLALPIGAIAFILLYYDMRIRKEGFNQEMLAKTRE